jgi:ADP-ribosylglycohydrolase
MATEMLRDRFRGCLIGQCIGDALGAVVEGHPPASCASYVASGAMGSLGRGPFPFGQYTDDSQLARELVQSIVECAAFDPADYARRVAGIFTEGRIVGRGRATENAAHRLAAGVPWDRAGEPPPSAGNGSAMRAGPVGLYAWDDPGRLVQVAIDQGRCTHADPRCSAGAIAIAAAVRLALQGEVAPSRFAAAIAELVAPTSPDVAAPIAELPALVGLAPDEAVRRIAGLGDFADGWQGISPFVTSSVVWSLYAFLRTPADFMAVMRTAIAVGGDVDTTAAMAGAIAGAHVGFEALPQPLAERVTDQGTWQLAELLALCDRLHGLVTRPSVS